MAEFTGERVIPGQVESDLWNEHISRYLFAADYAKDRAVLDIGCGTGYGAAELAQHASSVVGLDQAPEAIEYAREHYARPHVRFLQASCPHLPFADASFSLVTAFEVIEHLEDWAALLCEVRRVLTPDGLFLVSTPNREYYAESRRLSGPNPFHVHEFEYREFESALAAVFPKTALLTQNHTAAVSIRALADAPLRAVQAGEPVPEDSHFFLAICGVDSVPDLHSLAFLPHSGNVLWERERHIAKLEKELAQKTAWLEEQQKKHQELLAAHEENLREMIRRAEFAASQEQRIQQLGERILTLQDELQALHTETAATINDLQVENERKTQWAIDTETRLTAELHGCIDALHEVEVQFQERTEWALKLDAERQQLTDRLTLFEASRWVRLGRKLGVGPLGRA